MSNDKLASFGNNPPTAVQPCPRLEFVAVDLRSADEAMRVYSGERYEANLTSGTADGELLFNGHKSWPDIPCGVCEIAFTEFNLPGRQFVPIAF